MFELRWLERKTGKTKMNEFGYYYDETVKVLQFRTMNYVTDYGTKDQIQTLRISDWQDVPTVTEE
jgi:hypothetical protein